MVVCRAAAPRRALARMYARASLQDVSFLRRHSPLEVPQRSSQEAREGCSAARLGNGAERRDFRLARYAPEAARRNLPLFECADPMAASFLEDRATAPAVPHRVRRAAARWRLRHRIPTGLPVARLRIYPQGLGGKTAAPRRVAQYFHRRLRLWGRLRYRHAVLVSVGVPREALPTEPCPRRGGTGQTGPRHRRNLHRLQNHRAAW